jgi:hypothetical protein
VRREHLIAGAAGGAILLGLIGWLVTHTYWADVTRATAPRGEAARNSHYTLARLAARLGVRTHDIMSLRELPDDTVVLINDPKNDLLLQRVESIESWVESGGRLVLTGDILRAHPELQSWSGVRPGRRAPESAASVQAAADDAASSVPDPDKDCTPATVEVNGNATGQSLRLCARTAEFYWTSDRVPAWSLSDTQGPQVVSVDVGDGEVTVIGPAEVLGNRALLAGDNAELMIAAAGLRHQDTLLILSPPQLLSLPALLWRLAAPGIVFFVATVLLLVLRSSARFGPPVPMAMPPRRSLAEQICAYARFAWRTREPQVLRTAIRRSLEAAARRRLGGFHALDREQRAQRLAASTGIDSGAIAAALNEGAGGRRNEHRAAMTLLEVCRRILTTGSRMQGTLHDR